MEGLMMISAPKVYAARTRDDDVLMDSSSGGAFTELARTVIARGGVVFGAGWEAGFRVVHKWTDNERGLLEFRGSKYVHSDCSKVYEPLREFISQGRMVLFTGTPCQVAAIRKNFGTPDNLILVSLICHSTPDPKYWVRYLSEIEKQQQSRIRRIRFKEKSKGWHRASMVIEFEDPSKTMNGLLYDNPYALACFKGYSSRTCCLACVFRRNRAGADLMIGDFWGGERTAPALADDRGISAVLVYTKKGGDLLSRCDLTLEESRYEQVLSGNAMLEEPCLPDLRRRSVFQKVFVRAGFLAAFHAASRRTLRERTHLLIRRCKGGFGTLVRMFT